MGILERNILKQFVQLSLAALFAFQSSLVWAQKREPASDIQRTTKLLAAVEKVHDLKSMPTKGKDIFEFFKKHKMPKELYEELKKRVPANEYNKSLHIRWAQNKIYLNSERHSAILELVDTPEHVFKINGRGFSVQDLQNQKQFLNTIAKMFPLKTPQETSWLPSIFESALLPKAHAFNWALLGGLGLLGLGIGALGFFLMRGLNSASEKLSNSQICLNSCEDGVKVDADLNHGFDIDLFGSGGASQ